MSDRNEPPSQEHLDDLLAEYLQALEQGRAPSRDELLARHPELAAVVDSFLANLDQFRQAARPLLLHERETIITEGPGAGRTDLSPLSLGRVGDFELYGEIARGGMGVVYRGRQISLDRPVAVKMLRDPALASEEDVQRFVQEAEAAAALEHPNVVPIYHVGEEGGHYYFAMKLIDGESLADRLRAGKMPPSEAVRLLAPVARAVHFAHQRGILHRDLKPGNILLAAPADGGPSTPLLADFGLAKQAAKGCALTLTGAILGSPIYMSPEQANAQAMTVATDVWSLGVILYECLTGRPPFAGPTPYDTLRLVVAAAPAPPRGLERRIDRDLEAICLKCLEKDPARRYASADALAADLDRWSAGKPTLARPPGLLRRTRHWVRERRRRILGALLVLLAAGVWWGWTPAWKLIDARREQREREEDRARAAEYAERLRQAGAELVKERRDAADALLEQCPPDKRGWEWQLLKGICRCPPTVTELRGPAGPARRAEVSADGRYLFLLVTRENQTEMMVQDLSPGQKPQFLQSAGASPQQVVIGPDGNQFALTWPDTQHQVPGERVLVPIARHYVPIAPLMAPYPYPYALGPNPYPYDSFNPYGTNARSWVEYVERVQMRTVIQEGSVRVYGSRTGHQVANWQGAVDALALGVDDQTMATSRGTAITLRDARTGAGIRTVDPQSAVVSALAFSADGKRLFAGGADGSVRVIDLATGRTLRSLSIRPGALARKEPAAPTVVRLLSNCDGKRLAARTAFGSIILWDVETGVELCTRPGEHDAFAFSPDGRRLVVTEPPDRLVIVDAASGKALVTLPPIGGRGVSVAVAPDGRLRLLVQQKERLVLTSFAAP
jgi:tRNA A-37 threonylcarbamoyl transferase component Bud32